MDSAALMILKFEFTAYVCPKLDGVRMESHGPNSILVKDIGSGKDFAAMVLDKDDFSLADWHHGIIRYSYADPDCLDKLVEDLKQTLCATRNKLRQQ